VSLRAGSEACIVEDDVNDFDLTLALAATSVAPKAPVRVCMTTVDDDGHSRTFTLCTLTKTCRQATYVPRTARRVARRGVVP
jgi:hypothetical protein